MPQLRTRSVRFQPVGAGADFDDHRHPPQGQGVAHAAHHDAAHLLQFAVRHLEHQLVVHLQDHARRQPVAVQLAVDVEHGDLDHVGGAALDRRVDGDPFRRRARRVVA